MSHEPGTMSCRRGFTMIELVMVISVLGILAFTVLYRIDFSLSKSGVASDQLIADIRYIQTRAMGAGASQSITFTTGSATYTAGGEQKSLSGGVTVDSTSFGTVLTFNSLGEPTYGTGNGTINLSGGRTITIYGVTGKVE